MHIPAKSRDRNKKRKEMIPMNMFKKNGGFTLVELIVVIAILAILAGVAVPAYSGYITNANDAAVETELTAIKTAAMAANATSGEIGNIVVNGTSVKVTPKTGTLAADFEKDFSVFYGQPATPDGTNNGEITLTTGVDFSGSSYEGKIATWNGTEWKPEAAGNNG